jgi:hypothetical protein
VLWIRGPVGSGLLFSGSPDWHPGPVDSDPDLNPFQTNVNLNQSFSRKFQNTVTNIENYDTYDDDEKDKTM